MGHVARCGKKSAVASQDKDKVRPPIYQVFPLRRIKLRQNFACDRISSDRVTMALQPGTGFADRRFQLRFALLGND
jgi:hypothetical protein